MRSASLVGRARGLALLLGVSGCGNLLGIEVLSFDAGDETSPGADGPAQDGAPGDRTVQEASSPDGASGDSVRGDGAPGDGASGDGAAPGDGAPSVDGATSSDALGGSDARHDGAGSDAPPGDSASDATPTCSPGTTQCTAGNTAFQTCSGSGAWMTTATCTMPVNGLPTCNPTTGCGAGECPLPSASDLCGSACVDLATDGYNCGMCGQTCTGSTCSAGHCVVQPMCDGSSLTQTNAGNVARLALAMGITTGFQKVLYGYFQAGRSIFGCTLPAAAPAPAPLPIAELNYAGGVCMTSYTDPINDHSRAYTTSILGGDCHGTSLLFVPDGTPIASVAAAGATLVADVATDGGIYALATPVMDIYAFGTAIDGGVTATASPCLTVSGSLDDGAAGGGMAVAVDGTQGVIVGAAVAGGACGPQKELASGVTAENAVAVAPNGSLFAFVNGTSVYLCPTSGCTAAELATPLSSGQSTIAQYGLVFDSQATPNLYWVGAAGLSRCSAVVTGAACTPTVLVPGAAPTSGIAVDATYVYYLEGMVLYRVPK
jgi:hypothetical protein